MNDFKKYLLSKQNVSGKLGYNCMRVIKKTPAHPQDVGLIDQSSEFLITAILGRISALHNHARNRIGKTLAIPI